MKSFSNLLSTRAVAGIAFFLKNLLRKRLTGGFLCFALLFIAQPLFSEPTQKKLNLTEKDDFESLCGKDLPQWPGIKACKYWNVIEKYKKNYEKLSQETPDLSSYRIPKVIHVIWIGPKNFPMASIDCVRSWIALHPTWKVKFWTDRVRPCPCRSMEMVLVKESDFAELADSYRASGNWAEKADYLRYCILKHEGGVYVDHDARCLKSFDRFHREFDFYAALANPDVGSVSVPNGLLGVRPNHPILQRTIDVIKEKRQAMEELYPEKENENWKVLELSYGSFSEAIEEQIGTTGLRDVVFPTAYFWGLGKLPAFYIEHYYAGSWINRENISPMRKAALRKLKKMKAFSQTMMFVNGGLLCSVLCGVYFLRRERA